LTPASPALARVMDRGRLGIRLGLSRTRAILRALGDPQASLRGVLIGGTNGKGSTQAFVAAALREAGMRVGQTPKPHLSSYRERIVIDGRPIVEADLEAALEAALAAAADVEPRHGPATEFELLTAAAFWWLARAAVDVAVVEVGLGGRLDATNAWHAGVCAITNVGLDHEALLGESIVAIAREKAAIIKAGDRAVTGADGEALAVIRRRARRVGAPLAKVAPLIVEAVRLDGTRVRHGRLGSLTVGLLGRHQAHNAAVAVAVLEALRDAGLAACSDEDIRTGLAAARWPGRLEPLDRGGVLTILDGAHNPDGAGALARAIDDLGPMLPGGRTALLVAVMADKDVAGILAALATSPMLRDALVIATTVPGSDRALESDALAAAWGRVPRVRDAARAIADPAEALEVALRSAVRDGGPLVVAGSLYLVGYVRDALTGP
jgi:dihydrofolate synthase / folylpolyglutamate synthase